MLAIAPMPVNNMRDDFVTDDLRRSRVLVPAFPIVKENCEIVSIDEPTVLLVDESDKAISRTVLPKKKSNAHIASHIKGDPHSKKIDSAPVFRPAVPVAEDASAAVMNYEKNVVRRTYLIALFLFLVVVFLGGVIYVVKYLTNTNPSSATDDVGLRYVHIESPRFTHLKDQYGEQVKADQIQAKRNSENLPTQIVRDVDENNGQ